MAAASVLEFATAFNTGDRRRLSQVFADDLPFKWYSVSRFATAEHFVVYDKPGLLRYFAERHARNEGLAFMRFAFVGKPRAVGNFSYRLLRWADDIGSGSREPYDGKGAVRCTSRGGRLILWSMGSA